MAPFSSGESHPKWKGDKASYRSIHKWLVNSYGKADRCENSECPGTSDNYDYALIKGKSHSHVRSNYIMLCRSCHSKYDASDKKPLILSGLAHMRTRNSNGQFVREVQ